MNGVKIRLQIVCATTAAIVAGCQIAPSASGIPSPTPSAPGVASATPTPTPPAIAGQATGANVTLFGKKGERVATLQAAAAGFDPGNAGKILTVRGAKAELYDKKTPGEPTAEMTADLVTADREKRTLTATGNAKFRSLDDKSAPTVRADKMVWSFDESAVKGSGNVLLTAEPNYQMPGETFQADTRLQTFRVESNGQPATGG